MYTYCVNEQVGTHRHKGKLYPVYMNRKPLLSSDEFNNWHGLYKADLIKWFVTDETEEDFDVRQYYCDPDNTYDYKFDHDFFHQLIAFLRAREKQLANKLNGCFQYEFVEHEGIKVSKTDDDGKEITLFYLRSDQFGFSAPSEEKKYPYDLFIKKSSDKEAAIEQVITWIAISRTLGGSFLWPTPFYFGYNKARGGSVIPYKDYHIQDRVDLTLWEIKYWYQKLGEVKNTKMYNYDKENSNLSVWLEHFGDFDTYVEFFCLENFVEDMNPINILDRSTSEPKWGPNEEKPQKEITPDIELEKLSNMLAFVNNRIEERTNAITEILNGQ